MVTQSSLHSFDSFGDTDCCVYVPTGRERRNQDDHYEKIHRPGFCGARFRVHALGGPRPARAKEADRAYVNGKIYTVDKNFSTASTLAVKDGRFIYVGDDAGVKSHKESQPQPAAQTTQVNTAGLRASTLLSMAAPIILIGCLMPVTSPAAIMPMTSLQTGRAPHSEG